MRSRTSEGRGRADELRRAIDQTGYYPDVVASGVAAAVAGEPVESFLVHHEPTIERDEVRRHMSVLVLTPTRLVVTHTDEHAPDDLLPEPYTSTSTEAVPFSGIRSVVVNRLVADPASYGGRPVPWPGATEAVLTIGWGGVGRIDLEPAGCADAQCEADHGYTGVLASDDFSVRMSAAADGPDAVAALLEFAEVLSGLTHSSPTVAPPRVRGTRHDSGPATR